MSLHLFCLFFFGIFWPEPIYLDINFVLKCLSAHCGAKHPPFSSVLHFYAFSRVKSKKWRILLLKIFDKFQVLGTHSLLSKSLSAENFDQTVGQGNFFVNNSPGWISISPLQALFFLYLFLRQWIVRCTLGMYLFNKTAVFLTLFKTPLTPLPPFVLNIW